MRAAPGAVPDQQRAHRCRRIDRLPARIEDAPIIRAHDLSPEQNQALFDYFAGRQPDRRVYRVNRTDTMDGVDGDIRLEYLGTVAELSSRPPL